MFNCLYFFLFISGLENLNDSVMDVVSTETGNTPTLRRLDYSGKFVFIQNLSIVTKWTHYTVSWNNDTFQ